MARSRAGELRKVASCGSDSALGSPVHCWVQAELCVAARSSVATRVSYLRRTLGSRSHVTDDGTWFA
jgi:hypothetical protein